jgi:hypothetical protein
MKGRARDACRFVQRNYPMPLSFLAPPPAKAALHQAPVDQDGIVCAGPLRAESGHSQHASQL